jgi:iron(III) transport system substrate-binding protein
MKPCRNAFLGLLLVVLSSCQVSQPRVVLYCAQDREFAEEALAEFTNRTGLPVTPKFDTEADKSVSLYFEIVHEKDRPRCDVFWNNEILSTIRLQKQGLLEPYASPSAEPYPDWSKARDQTWQAFANRARVLIVNTDFVTEAERPRGLFDLTTPSWKGRIAMARPQFGTAATQAACLFQVLGTDKAQAFYRGLKANGVQIAPGNKDVAVWVGQGREPGGRRIAAGITDTDDAMEEVKAGRPVAIIYPDSDGMGTLFIPNSLAIVKGCPNPEGARKLVDYLLSPEVEERLATSESYQVPINPHVKASLPQQLRTPQTTKAMTVDYVKAAELWEQVQEFLKQEFQ